MSSKSSYTGQSLTQDSLNPRKSRTIAIMAMVGSAACWGGATVMSRDLLDQFQPPALLVVQLIASVIVLFLLSLPHRPWSYVSKKLLTASLTGIFEPGLTYSVGLWGLSLSTASSAAIIGSTEPIFIVLIAWLLLQIRPSRKLFICIFVAVSGLFLVSSSSFELGKCEYLYGNFLIVVSTVFAAIYVVTSAKLTHSFPAAVLATAQQIIGLVCAIVIYLLAKALGLGQSIIDIRIGTMIYAALSGVIQYALAFWLYLIGLRQLSPGAAGLWLTLVPVFGVIGAYFWLSEIPTVAMLSGMGLIICAVLIGRSEK